MIIPSKIIKRREKTSIKICCTAKKSNDHDHNNNTIIYLCRSSGDGGRVVILCIGCYGYRYVHYLVVIVIIIV